MRRAQSNHLPFPLERMQVKGEIKNERPTVLVVEDEPDIRELFRLTLEVAGYRVIEAENGVEGLTAARQYEPDAILMDMSMPLMDGCQSTRRIRQNPRLSRIPIIACTAYNRWEWRGKAILAGCTDFLPKPVDSDKLLTMLSRYLS
jgi:two-component system, sensor histidine kinase and response regulator